MIHKKDTSKKVVKKLSKADCDHFVIKGDLELLLTILKEANVF